MSDLFIHIHRFFRKRRLLFYAFFFIVTLLVTLAASRIRFEEDISGAVGGNDAAGRASAILRDLNIADRLVIFFSLNDTTAPADPETLGRFGLELADSLRRSPGPSLIRDLTFRTADTAMEALLALVTNHLPVFLEEPDYKAIDSLVQPASVRKAIEKDYRILASPAGIILKKRILADPLGITGPAFSGLKALKAGDHFDLWDGCVVTADHRTMLMFAASANPSSETGKNEKLIRFLDETIRDVGAKYPAVRVSYFGGVAVAVCNARQIKADIILTLAIATLLIFLLTGWYFRSFRVPLAGLLPALFGGLWALALLYLFKGRISAISLGIGSVILGLIVDYSLYVVTNFRKNQDVDQTLKEMAQTVVLCALTSAGAFLCLTFLHSTVLRDLGWFAAFSVAGAALFTLIVLPQWLGPGLLPPAAGRKPNIADRVAAIPFDCKPVLVVVLIAAAIAALFFTRRVDFEKNMAALNYMTPELVRAETELDRVSNYKLKNVYLVSPGRSAEEALKRLEKNGVTVRRLVADGTVRGVSGAGPLLVSDSLQDEKIARWSRFWSRERKEKLREELMIAARKTGFKDGAFEPFFQLLNRRFSRMTAGEVEHHAGALVSGWIIRKDTAVLAPVILRAEEKNIPRIYEAFSNDPETILFDRQTLTTRFIDSVRDDFEMLVNLSMIFVTLLLILSFGRLGLGMITALPMFLSWLLTLGFMGITGIRLNIFNIIISSFVFGLGVDYSILMMRGLQHSLRTGRDELQPYKVSVLLSSLTTLFGVGALFAARHPALHSISLVSIAGILSVVILSFVFPPLIITNLVLKRNRRGRYPVTVRIVIKTFVTWGNIVLIAVILMIAGFLINNFLPARRKKKELLFHHLFHRLTDLYIRFTFACDMKVINTTGEDFSRPAIIISNHQSLIETPAFLRLHPKILILTAPWVYRSPIFGPIARLASFFNIDHGIGSIVEPLKAKMDEGFSILIFPEAHRSYDHKIQRFHRGAFFLSEKLQVDILPIMVFGTGDFLGKGAFWGRPNSFRMKILPRVAWDDPAFGKDYQERSKKFRRFYIGQYSRFREEEGTSSYYRRSLALNYVLRGPILEWYMRVKMKLEDNYDLYCRLMPRQGPILDLGCGYGFISYMLMYTGENRTITGVDHDAEKIRIASGGWSACERIRFHCADVTEYPITPQAGFVLGDVLHYLSPAAQEELLRKCCANLVPGGVIMIREANADLESRHKRSKVTEFFSTRTGFNKTMTSDNALHFTSAGAIGKIAAESGLSMEVIDNKKVTSNNYFILKNTIEKE